MEKRGEKINERNVKNDNKRFLPSVLNQGQFVNSDIVFPDTLDESKQYDDINC